MESPYHQEPLESGEIRLLLLEGTSDNLRLMTEVGQLDNDPAYVALSYVWGDAPPSIDVNYNGGNLLVTASAY